MMHRNHKRSKRFIESMEIGDYFAFTFYYVGGPKQISEASAILRLKGLFFKVDVGEVMLFDILISDYPRENIKIIRIAKSKLIKELSLSDSDKRKQ
jgi:hypothetical protein